MKFDKKDTGMLSKYFSAKELKCQCNLTTCVTQNIDDDLLKKLDALRQEYGSPIKVTSGYRCPEHQADLVGQLGTDTVKNSQHCLGKAADISGADMDKLYKLCEKHFNAIGDGRKKGFIHVDMRPLKEDGSKRRWNYA